MFLYHIPFLKIFFFCLHLLYEKLKCKLNDLLQVAFRLDLISDPAYFKHLLNRID